MLPHAESTKFSPQKSTLGQRIAYARRKANMSRFELASEMGGHEDSICRYESNEEIPHIVTLKCMSEMLGVSREWLESNAPLNDEILLQSTIVRIRITFALRQAGVGFSDFILKLKNFASNPKVSQLAAYEAVLIKKAPEKAARQFLDPEEPIPSPVVLQFIAETFGVHYEWLSRESPTRQEKEVELLKASEALLLVDEIKKWEAVDHKRRQPIDVKFTAKVIAVIAVAIMIYAWGRPW